MSISQKLKDSKALKVSLFLTSLIVCLVLLETSLRFIGNEIYEERRDVAKNLKLKGPFTKKILSVGDSFTFGGNLEISDSYPYQLGKILKEYGIQNIEIFNEGVCEQRSDQLRRKFPSLIDEYAPNVVLILVGATDSFHFGKEDFWTRTVREDYSWMSRIRSVKLFRILYLNAVLKGKSCTWENCLDFSKNKEDPRVIDSLQAYIKGDVEKSFQLFLTIPNAKVFTIEEAKLEWKINIIGSYLEYKISELSKNQEYEKIVELSLEQLQRHPEFYFAEAYKFSNPIEALTIYLPFQSQYSSRFVRDEVLKLINQFGYQSVLTDQRHIYLQTFLKFLEDIDQFENEKISMMKENLSFMIEYAQKAGTEVVLQTYPTNLYRVNNAILEVAEKYKLKVIPHYEVFKSLEREKRRSEFIADDLHCTELGYYQMALNIKGHLRDFFYSQ